jgi:hypothetical protein
MLHALRVETEVRDFRERAKELPDETLVVSGGRRSEEDGIPEHGLG